MSKNVRLPRKPKKRNIMGIILLFLFLLRLDVELPNFSKARGLYCELFVEYSRNEFRECRVMSAI